MQDHFCHTQEISKVTDQLEFWSYMNPNSPHQIISRARGDVAIYTKATIMKQGMEWTVLINECNCKEVMHARLHLMIRYIRHPGFEPAVQKRIINQTSIEEDLNQSFKSRMGQNFSSASNYWITRLILLTWSPSLIPKFRRYALSSVNLCSL